MSRLMRFPGAVRRDPAVDGWMQLRSGPLGILAQRWFEVMRSRGGDVTELLHDGHPNFDITRKYGEIIGTVISTPIPPELTGIREYEIGEAVQNIRFRLDEKGAVLKSDATIQPRATAGPPRGARQPRRFVCDGPFLVMMARLMRSFRRGIIDWLDSLCGSLLLGLSSPQTVR